MAPLARISPGRVWARPARSGRLKHPGDARLPHHRHDVAFAAIVLAGGYLEAGDTGRHRMRAGDVLIHRPWEHHLDRFGRRGAEVCVVPLDEAWTLPVYARVSDPDLIARLAEVDTAQAREALRDQLEPQRASCEDWPDLLAEALRSDPSLKLGSWARARGLHLGSLSRGFGQLFGVTPACYRWLQRTHRALAALLTGTLALSQLAQECGFADQAHMSRAIRRVTGRTARSVRGAERCARCG